MAIQVVVFCWPSNLGLFHLASLLYSCSSHGLILFVCFHLHRMARIQAYALECLHLGRLCDAAAAALHQYQVLSSFISSFTIHVRYIKHVMLQLVPAPACLCCSCRTSCRCCCYCPVCLYVDFCIVLRNCLRKDGCCSE